MIKTTILASIILFSATMMVQEVSAEDIPLPIQHGGTGQAIPDWIKTQFEWYINGETDEKTLLTSMNWMFDNNIMHLSEEAAQEVQEMRNEIDDLKYELEATQAAIAIPNLLDARKSGNESSDTGSGMGDNSVQVVRVHDGDLFHHFIALGPSTEPIDINAMIQSVLRESYMEQSKDLQFYAEKVQYYNSFNDAIRDEITKVRNERQMTITQFENAKQDTVNPDSYNPTDSSGETRVLRLAVTTSTFASETVDDIMTKGGTTSAWEDGIAAFAEHGMQASVADDLQGIVVLCNTQIDKKTQSINAELKIIEKWLEIIEEKQTTNTASTDYYGRAEPTSNYNESDLDFISRQLVHIDQQINSLDTGIKVLEDKLESVGDDAQLANIDLQNQLQKLQKTIQSMSDDSKMLHDTAMSVIRKIG